MQILEEINTFQTQLDHVARGVNRIRYLKQKIQNTFGNFKSPHNLDDFSVQHKIFNPITPRLQSQSTTRNNHMFTLQSERNQHNQSKNLMPFCFNDTSQNFNQQSKNGIFRQKWNASFLNQTQQKKINSSFRHENPSKLQTFYLKSLLKNVDCTKKEQISLKELKKINYDSVKRQRKELNIKRNEEKENRTKQVQQKKEKVLMRQRLAKKKNECFIWQKLQDLRSRKMLDKQAKEKMLAFKIQSQLYLENKEAERLTKLQKAVLIKENMKKIIEEKMHKLDQCPSNFQLEQVPMIRNEQNQQQQIEKEYEVKEFSGQQED